MAWNAINQELWLKCMPLREKSDQPSGCAKVTAVQPVPGKCFDFNKACNWTNCHFAHTCESCGAKHARVNCPNSNANSGRVTSLNWTS